MGTPGPSGETNPCARLLIDLACVLVEQILELLIPASPRPKHMGESFFSCMTPWEGPLSHIRSSGCREAPACGL